MKNYAISLLPTPGPHFPDLPDEAAVRIIAHRSRISLPYASLVADLAGIGAQVREGRR